MPNIVVQNAEGQPELWENVNTVRFLNEEGGLVSYEYNSGEAPSEERPDLLPAPEGKVWVGFQDGDGSLLWNTLIDKGGSVEYPMEQLTPPEDDMEFVRWSWSKEDIRCIESDTVIAPVWKFKDFSIEDAIIKINTKLLGSSSVSVNLYFGNYDNEVAQGGQVDIDWGDGTTSVVTFPTSKTFRNISHTFTRTDYDNFQYIVVKRSGSDYITLGVSSTSNTLGQYGDNRDLYSKYAYSYSCFINSNTWSSFCPSILAIQFGTYDKYVANCMLPNYYMLNLNYLMLPVEHLDAFSCSLYNENNRSVTRYCVVPNTDILAYAGIYNMLIGRYCVTHTFAFGKHINNVLHTFDSNNYTNDSYKGENPTVFVSSNIALGLYTGVVNTASARRLKYFTIPWTHLNIVKYADYPKNQVKFRYFNLISTYRNVGSAGQPVLRTTLPNICPDDIPMQMQFCMCMTNAYGVNHRVRKFGGSLWITSTLNESQYPLDIGWPMQDIDLSEVNILYGSYQGNTGQFIVSNYSSSTNGSALMHIAAKKLCLNYNKVQLTSSTGKFPIIGGKCFIEDELTVLGEFHSYGNSIQQGILLNYSYSNLKYSPVRYNFPDTTRLPAYTFYGAVIKELNIPNVKSLPDYMFQYCVFTDGKFIIPEGVVSIGNYTLSYCQISEIHIPSTVENIGSYFTVWCAVEGELNSNSTNMPHIYIHRATPPVLGSNLYSTTNVARLGPTPRIHVPKDSVDLYKSASGWSAYARTIIGDL